MKRLSVISLASFFVALVVLTACSGLNKMKEGAANIKYTVTPKVLETHAGKVDIKIDVKIPPKFFSKKAIVTATPVLVYKGGEKAFKSLVLQGESVQENNTVVPFESGKTISYKGSIDYIEAMRLSELVVRIKAKEGKNEIDFDPRKIADGVMATATLVEVAPKAIVGKDEFKRIVPEKLEADIHYLINSSQVRGKEGRAEDIKKLKAFIKEAKENQRKELKGMSISAYASPDGEEDKNDKLAQNRLKSSKKYLKRTMRRAKVDELKKEEFFNTKYTAEDWEGFKKLMEESSIQDKELILRVLSMYSDPEVREREIKNIAATFSEVKKEILPKLRRAKYVVNVDLIGKSNEEILEFVNNKANELTVEEILYAATLVKTSQEKLTIYKKAIENYPNDWRVFNNAGLENVILGNVAEAKTNFTKADQLSADNKIVKNNLGVIELIEGKTNDSEVLFGAALGAGKEVNYNLGIIAIKKAEYEKAVRNFEGNSANAALAKILSGDNNGASDILNNNNSDKALVNYLKAVVAARKSDKATVISNLKNAISKDAKYKELAKTDVEFAAYFQDEEFKAAIQ